MVAVYKCLMFGLLVTMGVGGRLFEPQWCFTPTAAVAMFAGFYFARLRVALLLPICVLALSDLFLPAYGSSFVMTATYGVFFLPVLLGRHLRNRDSLLLPLAFGLLSAVSFYLTTNFAVWLFDPWYPPTFAGLLECYLAAVPFFRWMVAGDIFYVAALFGTYALATDFEWLPRRKVRVRA